MLNVTNSYCLKVCSHMVRLTDIFVSDFSVSFQSNRHLALLASIAIKLNGIARIFYPQQSLHYSIENLITKHQVGMECVHTVNTRIRAQVRLFASWTLKR